MVVLHLLQGGDPDEVDGAPRFFSEEGVENEIREKDICLLLITHGNYDIAQVDLSRTNLIRACNKYQRKL